MNFLPGSTVLVKNKDGALIQGEILHQATNTTWWVSFINGDTNEITVFDELELINWGEPKICQCGAESTGQPGHSFWCDVYA